MNKPVKVQVKRVTSGKTAPMSNKPASDQDTDDQPSARSAIIDRLAERAK